MLVLQCLLIGECSLLFFYCFFCSLAHISFCFTWLRVTGPLFLSLYVLKYFKGHYVIIFSVIFLFFLKVFFKQSFFEEIDVRSLFCSDKELANKVTMQLMLRIIDVIRFMLKSTRECDDVSHKLCQQSNCWSKPCLNNTLNGGSTIIPTFLDGGSNKQLLLDLKYV